MSLALVYLARGVDGGLVPIQSFFEAYAAYPAGCAHDLIIIAKGWDSFDDLSELKNIARKLNVKVYELPDDGYDWGAYMRLAPLLNHEWVCFLNTHSRPCAKNWLSLMISPLVSNKKLGLVGATGSWGTLSPVVPYKLLKEKSYIYFSLRHPIRFFINMYNFTSFPNPHLRSNAFVIQTKRFLEFSKNNNIPRTKHDAYKLESGKHGLTSFILQKNLDIGVAAKDGNLYLPKNWLKSNTFCISDQKNLLVEDNVTSTYKIATKNKKRIMQLSAWGNLF